MPHEYGELQNTSTKYNLSNAYLTLKLATKLKN